MRRIMSTIADGGVSCKSSAFTPSALSFGRSSSGITPPPTTRIGVAFLQQVDEAGKDGHVRTGKDADADDIHVFLDRCLDDLFRGPVKAGIDDVHARVAQRARDDLDAPVVSVETDLRDHDPDRLRRLLHCSSSSDAIPEY
jgi:hypothetical protein